MSIRLTRPEIITVIIMIIITITATHYATPLWWLNYRNIGGGLSNYSSHALKRRGLVFLVSAWPKDARMTQFIMIYFSNFRNQYISGTTLKRKWIFLLLFQVTLFPVISRLTRAACQLRGQTKSREPARGHYTYTSFRKYSGVRILIGNIHVSHPRRPIRSHDWIALK